jgi:hypothetical protein
VFWIFLFATFIGFGQTREVTEDEKAVVYFFEISEKFYVSGGVGIYDGQEAIGVLREEDYIRYECTPGEHLFYSLANENKSFLDAELMAGKVYIIEVEIRVGRLSYVPSWGPSTNRALMKPVNPAHKLFDIEKYRKALNKKRSKQFYWFSEREDKIFLESAEKNKLDTYQRRLNKYHKKKKKEKVEVLHPGWYIESETMLLQLIENETKESLKEANSQSHPRSMRDCAPGIL